MESKTVNCCGKTIAKLRGESKPPMTQEALATALQRNGLDIDRATIAKIETQRRRVYDIEVLAFSKILKTTPNQLLQGE